MKIRELFKIDLKGKMLLDLVMLAIVALLCYVAPFASYTYKKVTYTISGLEFLMGKEIMGGKIILHTNTSLVIVVVLIGLLLLVGLFLTKIKPKFGGGVVLLTGLFLVILNVIFSKSVETILEKAKNVHMSYGYWMLLIIAVLLIVRGFNILYQLKSVTPLDFMVMTGLTYLFINNYLPMMGVALAFKKINFAVGIWKSDWVGFANFKYLFATTDAFIITRNTIAYNLVFIIVGNVLGIIVGICLSEIFSKKLQKLFQTTILIPQLISMIIVAYIVFGFISNESGWINNTLLDGNKINFYATKAYWPLILVFVNTWKGLGYSSIIFMSSIIGIDRMLYEAAYVDGCGRWKQIVHITLPLLKPTVITLLLIQVGRIFYSDFGLFYQVPMDSGALYSVTQTIDTYVYRGIMKTNNISMASAASAYQSIVGFIVILIVNGFVRKVDKDSSLF